MATYGPDELDGEIQRDLDDGVLGLNLGKIPEGVERRSWASAIYYVVRDRWPGSRSRESISVRDVVEREGGGWRVTIYHGIVRDYHSQYDSTAEGTAVVDLAPDLGVLGSPEWNVREGPYPERESPDVSASAEALRRLRSKGRRDLS